ncbi:hypothetical protein ACQJBY_011775 [Aegilops geniculata]
MAREISSSINTGPGPGPIVFGRVLLYLSNLFSCLFQELWEGKNEQLDEHGGGKAAAGVPVPPEGPRARAGLSMPQALRRWWPRRWSGHGRRRPQQVRAMGASRRGLRGRQGVVLLQPARPQVRDGAADQPRHAHRLLEGHGQGPRHHRRRRGGGRRDAQDARLLPGESPPGNQDRVGHARVPRRGPPAALGPPPARRPPRRPAAVSPRGGLGAVQGVLQKHNRRPNTGLRRVVRFPEQRPWRGAGAAARSTYQCRWPDADGRDHGRLLRAARVPHWHPSGCAPLARGAIAVHELQGPAR